MCIIDGVSGVLPDSSSRVGSSSDAVSSCRNALSVKRVTLPTQDIPIGGVAVVRGRRFLCVERDSVAPPDACSGCDIAKLYLNCTDLKCSVFDRSDRRFVWFKVF